MILAQNTLGRTDLQVSKLCLGTMTFGEQNSPAESFAIMDVAVEEGINFFDTAEIYAVPPKAETYGRSEEIVGQWLGQKKNRDKLVIATKVSGPAPHLPWVRHGQAKLDRENILAAVEGSLKRLGTDYIDLYQAHWPMRPVNTFGRLGFDGSAVTGTEDEAIAETLEVMQGLVKAGKIRFFGLCNETPWGVTTHLKMSSGKSLPRVVSIQNPYSLLNRSFDVGLAEIALQEKTGLLAYAPLAAGTLTGKYLNGQMPKGSRQDIDTRPWRYNKPGAEEAVTAYVALAEQHGLAPAVLAHAFVQSRPFLTASIVGATKPAHLESAVAAVKLKLAPEILDAIEEIHTAHPNPCP